MTLRFRLDNHRAELNAIETHIMRFTHQIASLEEAICPRVAARLTALERANSLRTGVPLVKPEQRVNNQEVEQNIRDARLRATSRRNQLAELARSFLGYYDDSVDLKFEDIEVTVCRHR